MNHISLINKEGLVYEYDVFYYDEIESKGGFGESSSNEQNCKFLFIANQQSVE